MDTNDLDIHGMVSKLALLRQERDDYKATMDEIVERAKGSDVYTQAVELHNATQLEVSSLEEKIRNWATTEYRVSGNKKPYPALQIRVTKAFSYASEKAMEWCEKNLPVAIKRTVDTKLFEKTIQSLDAPPDFVVSAQEPKATIATDLSEYLVQETEPEKLGQDELPF